MVQKKNIVIITPALIATHTRYIDSTVMDVIYNCPHVVKVVDNGNSDFPAHYHRHDYYLGCHLVNGCFVRWTPIGLFHACLHEQSLLYIRLILANIEYFIQRLPPHPIIIIIIYYSRTTFPFLDLDKH